MKQTLKLLAATATLLAVLAAPGFADSYIGKIDLVQSTGTGTRFFIRVSPKGPISLYASVRSDMGEILLRGFYQKATFSIAYAPIVCSGGVTGVCGNVVSVTVDAMGGF